MQDLIGRTLGHYRIVEKIGAGGMGVVYRANDERLGRDVAVKTLLGLVAQDEQRMARFEREAKLLASLSHQNIAALHGLEKHEGQQFLVMELAEGTTLANRIALRPIPIDDALDYACQIAEGLEAAHGKGIIHRDLKPANIMLSAEGGIKILDFGLAKGFEPSGSSPSTPESIADSPTLTAAVTGTGVLLGTVAYMSPEQARGKAVDKRTDIWAFGCVLYEMLTGHKVFQGNDASQVMAAILRDEPEWSELPPGTPDHIRRLLARCLVKNPRDRLHDIADARIELSSRPADGEIRTETNASAQGRRGLRTWLPWGLVAVLVALAIWGFFGLTRTPVPRAVRKAIIGVQPAEWLGSAVGGDGAVWESFRLSRTALALSPDDRYLVFVGGDDEGSRLYLRALGEPMAVPVAGTEGGVGPFFSPDGEWIGFWADGRIKKVRTAGGPSMIVCAAPEEPFGASWGPDGTIVIGQMRGPILKVLADGGVPEEITTLAEGESSHRHPQFLADGDTLLFTVRGLVESDWNNIRIVAQSLKTGGRKTLVENGADARYSETGHLVFCRLGALMAVPFDPKRLEVTGGAVVVLESVRQGVNASNSGNDTFSGQFSLSPSGTLVHVPGGIWPNMKNSLVWVDREGHEEPLPAPPRQYASVRLSPDGLRVAAEVSSFKEQDLLVDIWVYEIARGTMTRITHGQGRNEWPHWTPDGSRITFGSDRSGREGIFSIPADGIDSVARLSNLEGVEPASWSPDGQVLALLKATDAGDRDIWMLPRDGEAEPFIESSYWELWPTFSPDGRWLAYASTQSGRPEVYLTPYPGPGPRVQISTESGWSPSWAPNGRELFFLIPAYDEGTISMWAVDITTEPDLKVGRPRMLFKGEYANMFLIRGYDVAPDGEAFLFIKPDPSPEVLVTQIHVTFNWFEELNRLAPPD